jgi:hypothetical protein
VGFNVVMWRIPKKLHMYWDRSPMARLQVFTVETFHRLNPSWEILVHTPTDNAVSSSKYVPPYTGRDYFHLVEEKDYVRVVETDLSSLGISKNIHEIQRSDIFRCHILYQEGGAWCDFDVVWLRPMSHIEKVGYIGVKFPEAGATVTFFHGTYGWHNIGILLAAPGHGLYSELIEKAEGVQKRKQLYDHQSFGILMWAELYKTFGDIRSVYPDVVALPYKLIAPYSIKEMSKLYLENDISPLSDVDVMGLHWFNGHVLSKRYINKNLFEVGYNCSLTTVLKGCGYEGL